MTNKIKAGVIGATGYAGESSSAFFAIIPMPRSPLSPPFPLRDRSYPTYIPHFVAFAILL